MRRGRIRAGENIGRVEVVKFNERYRKLNSSCFFDTNDYPVMICSVSDSEGIYDVRMEKPFLFPYYRMRHKIGKLYPKT